MRIIIETENGQMKDVVATPNIGQALDLARLLVTSEFRDMPEKTQIAMMDLVNGLRNAANLDDL